MRIFSSKERTISSGSMYIAFWWCLITRRQSGDRVWGLNHHRVWGFNHHRVWGLNHHRVWGLNHHRVWTNLQTFVSPTPALPNSALNLTGTKINLPKFSLEFDSKPNSALNFSNSALNLPKPHLEFAQIQPWTHQNQTPTLPKSDLDFAQNQNQAPTLPNWRTKGTKCMSSHGWRWSLSSFWWSWWEPLCHC